MWRQDALSYAAASLELVLEGVLVIAVLILAIMGTQLPKLLIFLRVTPGALLITASWLIGVWLLSKARKDLPWQEKGRAPDTLQGHRGDKTKGTTQKWSTSHIVIVFL